ncbi:MAG: aminotransferase DegT [Candidatus Parcubacteria bacterium]|nr:MAG: aminotransferase DegT [Candidatus Pacearchaeota archaeon]GIW65351.1 MAG: aminotransferase DegT [Candidatus Parcubacteria bacterium]
MRINWNEPRFGSEELKEVEEVIKKSYINEGPKTKELEENLREYLGVKHVILTTSGTAGLFLAIKADSLIKGKKDFEVIVPDLTMIATATAVGWAGGKPIIVDVEKEKGTIDFNEVYKKINEKTIAIIPVHVIGRAANNKKLEEISREFNITIIEDAAGALGSMYCGRYLGTLGKVGVFSLQSNKIITSGQGGIVVTNDDVYYETIRRLRDFGRMNNKEFFHEIEGYNLKFNDLSAAIALAQFRKIEERKEMLLEQRELYEKRLSSIEEIKFFPYILGEIPLWVDVLVKNRRDLVNYLNQNKIYPRECWPALHMNPPYRDHGNDVDFPVATMISNNSLWLPNGPAISKEQIIYISKKINEFYKNGT